VEGRLDEDYIQTLGVVPMSKTIRLRNTDVTFSIWDLGGQREFLSMLPLVSERRAPFLLMRESVGLRQAADL
jgi:GTP-binding protein of the ras superfamily involved in termination of M-phase